MVDESAVQSALAVLQPSLSADGFELRAGPLSADNSVQVILAAKPDACLDCLVPDDLMVRMLRDAIAAHDPSVATVELVKEGFEGVIAH